MDSTLASRREKIDSMHHSMSIAEILFYISPMNVSKRAEKKECTSILLLIEGEMAILLRRRFVLFTPSHPSHKCCDQVKSKVTGYDVQLSW
jgi:hypothetical protein